MLRTAFRVPFAVKLWGSWDFFREEVPSGGWGGASRSYPSLRSVRRLGVGWVRYAVTLKQRRSRLLAPRQGGGVRCAALFGYIARPYTRCAASLRMTRRVAGARVGKQNAVSISLTVLYFAPNIYGTTPLSPTCHPERSGTNIKNQAHPPIIAAQRTPPQAGRQQAGSPLLRGTT